MNIHLNLNRRRQGVFLGLFAIIVVLVAVIVVIAWIAYECIHCIKQIVPPPPPSDGIHLTIGDPYDGGILVGFTNPPVLGRFNLTLPETVTPLNATPWVLSVYADDAANPPAWTNCIWTTNFASSDALTTFLNDLTINTLTVLDPVTNAPMRFYNIRYSPPQ